MSTLNVDIIRKRIDTVEESLAVGYFCLGSNLGDRANNIKKAINLLRENPTITVRNTSSFYETEPVGYKEQPWFINMVISVETSLTVHALYEATQKIETLMGKQIQSRWGPRIIDIDILTYNDEVINTDSLQIPHPRLHERAFVLVGLSEIIPTLVHPVLKRTVSELLININNVEVVKKYFDENGKRSGIRRQVQIDTHSVF